MSRAKSLVVALPALLVCCLSSHSVDAHAHVNFASWDAQLAASNCTDNYTTSFGRITGAGNGTAANASDDANEWDCFDLQLKFLSLAGCRYFSTVDCQKHCDVDTEAGKVASGAGTKDKFGNDEFSYCEVFCRARNTIHPPGGSTQLGCAHSATATSCNCTVPDCAPNSNNADDPPAWCPLYCDKVAASCSVQEGAGCAFAEAKATLGGSLVNISRVLDFEFEAANVTATPTLPSLDSICTTRDEACAGSSSTGCSFSEVEFSDMGSEEAKVVGKVTGLLDAPLVDMLPQLVVTPAAAPLTTLQDFKIEPSLDMICLGSIGDLFAAHMPTVDPFAEVEAAIAGYYDCTNRPERWCKNNAAFCTWDGGQSQCLANADVVQGPTTIRRSGQVTTEGPASDNELDSHIVIAIAISVSVVVIIVVIAVAVVCAQRMRAKTATAALKRSLTHEQAPKAKVQIKFNTKAMLRTRSQRTAPDAKEEQALRGIAAGKKKYDNRDPAVSAVDKKKKKKKKKKQEHTMSEDAKAQPESVQKMEEVEV